MEIPLVDFATKKTINFRTLIRPGVPLVLNFGSCTWPPFVGALDSFSQVMKKFPKFDYCIIYIAEAHSRWKKWISRWNWSYRIFDSRTRKSPDEILGRKTDKNAWANDLFEKTQNCASNDDNKIKYLNRCIFMHFCNIFQ